MSLPPWAIVMFRDGNIVAYPSDSREKAEDTVRAFAGQVNTQARFGVYELRASAVVETAARFENMEASRTIDEWAPKPCCVMMLPPQGQVEAEVKQCGTCGLRWRWERPIWTPLDETTPVERPAGSR